MTLKAQPRTVIVSIGKFLSAAVLSVVLNAFAIWLLTRLPAGMFLEDVSFPGLVLLLIVNVSAVLVSAARRQYAVAAGLTIFLIGVAYVVYIFVTQVVGHMI